MKELLLQLCTPAGVSGAEKTAAQEAAEALSAFAQVHICLLYTSDAAAYRRIRECDR